VCVVGAKPGIVAIASNDTKASDSEMENTNSFVRCMGVSAWHEWNSIVITFCPGE
jgi:flavin reductase (DIM6/NTAB) family NADH-FMN oxidoreductase RutF